MTDMFSGSRNVAITVDATSLQVADVNYGRKVLYMRNSSTGGQLISITMGTTAAILNAGITLSTGQNFADSNSEGYTVWTGQVQAISSAAGGILSLFER